MCLVIEKKCYTTSRPHDRPSSLSQLPIATTLDIGCECQCIAATAIVGVVAAAAEHLWMRPPALQSQASPLWYTTCTS
jgi:hypothetical protein